MDMGKVVSSESIRQALIKLQKGDGTFNPLTGVYKYGDKVYDLTKTDGEGCLGFPPIRSNIIKYNKMKKAEEVEMTEISVPLGSLILTPLQTKSGVEKMYEEWKDSTTFKDPIMDYIYENNLKRCSVLTGVGSNPVTALMSGSFLEHLEDGTYELSHTLKIEVDSLPRFKFLMALLGEIDKTVKE